MKLTDVRCTTLATLLVCITALTAAKPLSRKGVCVRGSKTPVEKCKKEGDFMLTFDDGPSDITQSLLDKLEDEGITAAMFVNGNNGKRCIYDHAEELQAAYKAGHAIGSHTWTHTAPTLLTGPMMEEELDKIEEAMVKILGVKPKLYMPPYGEIHVENTNVTEGLEVLQKRGYTIIYWTVTANSGDDEGAAYALEQFDKFLDKGEHKSGISVSLDPNEEVVTGVISQAIEKLISGGMKMVGAEECLGIDLYKFPTNYDEEADLPQRDETWVCEKKEQEEEPKEEL